ncbi:hypothetical protein D1007_16155 [Hordeum vulgare]|nr:hypothetical protein D1007_16155 [Hordeum vulgare]
MDGYFPVKENKKEQRYKLMLGAQKERINWYRKRMETKLVIKWEKIELEKHEVAVKCDLKKAKTFVNIELEKKILQITRDGKDAKIVLADKSLLDE